MKQFQLWFGQLIDDILKGSNSTEAYFQLVGVFLVFAVAVGIIWYIIFYLFGNKNPISKRDLKIAAIILITLIAVGWLVFPILGNMIWNYGAKGMPTAEDNNKELNEILKDYNARNNR